MDKHEWTITFEFLNGADADFWDSSYSTGDKPTPIVFFGDSIFRGYVLWLPRPSAAPDLKMRGLVRYKYGASTLSFFLFSTFRCLTMPFHVCSDQQWCRKMSRITRTRKPCCRRELPHDAGHWYRKLAPNHRATQWIETSLKQELSSSWDGRPFGHNEHGPKVGRGCWGLGPHLTQCGLGRGLPLYQVASSSTQPFGHNCRNATLRVGIRIRTIFYSWLSR